MTGWISGRQLTEQARQASPHLRVLCTSGYTENSIVHNGRLDPGVNLLNKPYRRQDLATKLRSVLDKEPDCQGSDRSGTPGLDLAAGMRPLVKEPSFLRDQHGPRHALDTKLPAPLGPMHPDCSA